MVLADPTDFTYKHSHFGSGCTVNPLELPWVPKFRVGTGSSAVWYILGLKVGDDEAEG